METATRLWVRGEYGTKKEYHVFLNQTGTNNPVATVLFDTITLINVTRSLAGTYLFTKTNAFPMDKSVPKDTVVAYDKSGNKLVLTHVSKDQYKLETYNNMDVLADGILTNQEFHLVVYYVI